MKKVIVIGGGVVGLCSAYFLHEAGHEVILFEKTLPEEFGGKPMVGASFGNAGYICPSHVVPLAQPGMISAGIRWMFNPESPFYIKPKFDLNLISWGMKFYRAATDKHVNNSKYVLRDMSLLSKKLYQDFSKKEGFEFAFEEQGLVNLFQTEKGRGKQLHEAEVANAVGIEAKELSADEVQALDPKLKMNIKGAIYYPDDAHLYPHLFMQSVRKFLHKKNVNLHFGTEVQKIISEKNKVKKIVTSKGEFTADEYVITSGAWAPELVKELKINIPIQAAKGYNMTIKNPEIKPVYPYLLSESKVAVTPMGNDLRFAGTLEIAGINDNINQRRVDGILKSVPKYFPDFSMNQFEGIEPWSGLRPCSPDGMPYLGRTKNYQNLTIAAGHAMVGMSLGPGTGKIVSEIISDEKPSIEHPTLNPDRFN